MNRFLYLALYRSFGHTLFYRSGHDVVVIGRPKKAPFANKKTKCEV
jgi:hypothetical protein